MNELTTIEPGQMQTAAQVKAQVQLIQEVMKAVMKDGVHYGTIPGCGDKKTLLKPGAEKLLSTFGIAVDPEAEDLSTPDEARFRVKTRGTHGGIFLGTGIGEASSNEEKYKWRRAICDEEFVETPEDRRREKWARDRNGNVYKVRQVRMQIADIANTVLKMAKKRSQTDLCLTTTAASDIFTQDIEDMPEEIAAEIGENEKELPGKPPVTMPQSTAPASPLPPAANTGKSDRLISEPQAKRLFAIAKTKGLENDRIKDIVLSYGYQHTKDIKLSDYDSIVNAIMKMQPDREPGQEG